MNAMKLTGRNVMTFLNLVIILLIRFSDGFHFTRSTRTYAKFPKWDACVKASISFEFKTRFADSLLLYTDDNGNFDYVEIVLKSGSVRLRINIVDGRDGSEEITLGRNLNDGTWHRVEVRRNRMESTLYVDSEHASKVAFGSDFNFGDIATNNYVYFGGLPETYHNPDQNKLAKLSLSSSYFEPRFEGEIRNVFYGNCTCKLSRGVMIEGESASRNPPEACEQANQCDPECLCISRDEGAGCQCKGLDCDVVTGNYYRLPMDKVWSDKIVNPSGLDAKVTGNPAIVAGVVGKALKIDEKFQKITVSGPGHRNECFGDIELCPQGYTLGLWVRFDEPGPGNGVYISNGAQSPLSHGVAMLYRVGHLEWIFKTKGTAHEWRVTASNILPRHWYHVTVTWAGDDGLALFINGNKVAHSSSPRRVASTINTVYNDFIIGQSNDGQSSTALGTMTIDEFRFWSRRLGDESLREMGPIYRHHLSMDQFEGGQFIVPYLEPRVSGNVRQVPGKIGKAVQLNGKRQYIDLGSFYNSCLGNTSLCMYGFTVTSWLNIKQIIENAYLMASGPEGFTIFTHQNSIYVTVQEGDRQWVTSTSGFPTGAWFFLEVTWSRTSGLSVYVNRMLVSLQLTSIHMRMDSSLLNKFFVGRANTVSMYYERYADAMFDEIEMYNAERQRLLAIDYILRGRPDKSHIGFDKIVGDKIDHPSIVIETTGSPSLVPGKIFNALRLNGSAQTAEFDHGDGCLGNLDYCLHGVLLAIWIRPEKFQDGMYYLSSGINGIDVYWMNGELRVTVTTTTQQWQAVTPDMTSLRWHYLEISWDTDIGLKLYSNNKLLEEDLHPKENTNTYATTDLSYDKFMFGNNNGRKGGTAYPGATYDEMEFWLASREYLLAFEYIQRGRPTNYRIDMDITVDQGRRLYHQYLPIILHGQPSLVKGKLQKAVQLNALSKNAQFIDIGDQTDKCLGNLQKCKFGITISFWIKIDNYYNNMYILSTGLEGIRIYFQTGNIYFRIDKGTKTWRTVIPKVSEQEWHLLEMSWHPVYGLNVYVDKVSSAHAQYRTITHPLYQVGTRAFYIGAPNSADSFGQLFSYGNFVIDELEVWYGRREYLLAFGYILRDHVEYESFSMETMASSGDVIYHDRYNVTLEQGARLVHGKVGNAVSLEGKGQYVDLGAHMDTCMSNLDLCDLGLTMALWLRPNTLQNNTYYLSGPNYSVYYADGKLKADFMSRGKLWNVETSLFQDGAWNHVMLSWDREEGLQMFVDNREVDENRTPTETMQGDQAFGAENLYIGKYAGAGAGTTTTNMQADEVQFWFSSIDKLSAQGLYGFPIHEKIPISDLARGGILKLGTRNISLENGGKIAEGQYTKAIQLDGKHQYIDMGKGLVCGGNLDECHQGFTVRFSVKPDKLVDNTFFLDSYPLSVFYSKSNSYGRLYATARTSDKTWTVAYPGFKINEWQVVDVSWHPEIGLTMHVNDEDVGAHKTHGTDKEPEFNSDQRTFFGRSVEGWQMDRHAATSLETFEVWNIRRDVLLSNGYKFVPQKSTLRPPVTSTAVPKDEGHGESMRLFQDSR